MKSLSEDKSNQSDSDPVVQTSEFAESDYSISDYLRLEIFQTLTTKESVKEFSKRECQSIIELHNRLAQNLADVTTEYYPLTTKDTQQALYKGVYNQATEFNKQCNEELRDSKCRLIRRMAQSANERIEKADEEFRGFLRLEDGQDPERKSLNLGGSD